MNTVTSAQIRRGALDPAMDAVAVGDQARQLWHRPETREADSIVELLVAQQAITERLADMLLELAVANGIELHLERQVTGWADRLVAALHDIERNGPTGQTLSGRRLAHMLLAPLDVLGDPGRPKEYQAALRTVHDLFTTVPPDGLFRDAVTYHLGQKRTTTLRNAHERWRASRKGRS
jgi:hypothetical protein